MNPQPVLQARSSSNGYGRRKTERDSGTRSDKSHTGKTSSTRTSSGGMLETSSRDRLVYVTTCLIGQEVEVHVLDGSIFYGVFHATNAEDFGVVLKMARLLKDCSRGQVSTTASPSKPLSRTLIVPAKDLVQVIAKGVPLTKDGLTNEVQHEKQQELMTDSFISQSRHVDLGRELERWVPDESDPGSTDLENIFDGSWNRGWNQFEVNETLFGVKSTFDEELYTTKLERGPKMRDLEREAMRLAREIEGEETLDLHLAEERGIFLDGNLEIDEEARYSSVLRGDDSGFDEIEDMLLDSRNDETFGDVSDSIIGKPIIDGLVQSSVASRDVYHSGSVDQTQQHAVEAEQFHKKSSVTDTNRHDNLFTGHMDSSWSKAHKDNEKVTDLSDVSNVEDLYSWAGPKKEGSDKVFLSANATAFDPSRPSSRGQDKALPSNELPEGTVPLKTAGVTGSLPRPSSSASSASDRGGATSTSAGRGLSPSSSVGSLTSEKSTLNPHAKEFKFNPNAKSFSPIQTPLRPSSPAPDNTLYYPPNMSTVTNMHGMPVGIGIGPSFSPQQPVIFNHQGAPIPTQYYHPNGPQMQYGQQMMGQARPILYMPTYHQDMQYKGREY